MQKMETQIKEQSALILNLQKQLSRIESVATEEKSKSEKLENVVSSLRVENQELLDEFKLLNSQ